MPVLWPSSAYDLRLLRSRICCRRPGTATELKGQHSQMTNCTDAFMFSFIFFLIAMDPNGFQFNPRTFRIVVRFPFHITGLLHQRRRARELRGVVRGRVCAEGRVGKSYHFPQVSYLSNMGNEKKTKNVARFSSELSKAIQFQGKFASKF